jgi:hypothetical protein
VLLKIKNQISKGDGGGGAGGGGDDGYDLT